MTEHGACIRCHRPAVWVCYHRKDTKTVVARLCHGHRQFAPKRTTMEKLTPLPPEPDLEERPTPEEIVHQEIERCLAEINANRLPPIQPQAPRPPTNPPASYEQH
jgi:hypothetical protein